MVLRAAGIITKPAAIIVLVATLGLSRQVACANTSADPLDVATDSASLSKEETTSPWGSSTFGSASSVDFYSGAGQLSIRRSGWSWPNPDFLSNYGPFCALDSCHSAEARRACKRSGGQPINDGMFCAWDRPRTVLGPTCHKDYCYEGTAKLCSRHGGQSIADMWCILSQEYSVVGPAAFGDFTYPELERVCSNQLGGESIGALWCVTKGM